MKRAAGILLLLSAVIAACGPHPTGDPVAAVERYLQAKAAGDAEAVQQLLCAEMEADLEREANAFAGLEGTRIEGLVCKQANRRDVVQCSGKIIAVYGAEASEFPLSSYRVVQEGGDWKWCGEAP